MKSSAHHLSWLSGDIIGGSTQSILGSFCLHLRSADRLQLIFSLKISTNFMTVRALLPLIIMLLVRIRLFYSPPPPSTSVVVDLAAWNHLFTAGMHDFTS